MTFENVAYLFDTNMMGSTKVDTVYGVLSFLGNKLFIPAYASEIMEKYDFSAIENADFDEWIKEEKNSEQLFNFLITLHDDVEKLGIHTFFIEKDYSAFICMMGLMLTNIKVNDPDFRMQLDNLYHSFQKTYYDRIIKESVEETVTVFNERLQYLLQSQKEHHAIKTMVSEHTRNIKEQQNILKKIEQEDEKDFIVTDYYFYARQLVAAYKEKEIQEIYSSGHAAKRFSEVIGKFVHPSNINIELTNRQEDGYEKVTRIADVIIRVSKYFVEKVLRTTSVEDLDEMDRYLFVITWMILQGGDNNMFINGRSYEMIREIFMSLKTKMDV